MAPTDEELQAVGHVDYVNYFACVGTDWLKNDVIAIEGARNRLGCVIVNDVK